jgi:hypothetical protein
MRIIMDWYLSRHQWLLWDARSKQTKRLATLLAAAPVVVFGLAMVVADALPELSLALYFSLPLMYFILVAVLKADPRTHDTADEVA